MADALLHPTTCISLWPLLPLRERVHLLCCSSAIPLALWPQSLHRPGYWGSASCSPPLRVEVPPPWSHTAIELFGLELGCGFGPWCSSFACGAQELLSSRSALALAHRASLRFCYAQKDCSRCSGCASFVVCAEHSLCLHSFGVPL